MKKLKILVIDDEELICWAIEKKLKQIGFDIRIAYDGESGIKIAEKFSPDIIFVDNKLPDISGLIVLKKIKDLIPSVSIVFMTAYGTIETAVKAIKYGAIEFVQKPFKFEEIEVIVEKIKVKIQKENEIQILKREHEDLNFKHVIGKSDVIKHIIQDASKIANSQATTILLLGESGTGKDLLANAIHNESERKHNPFVTINCSSLPETLLESELFGHEKGAFTDAKTMKKGLFEIADGGTVYLDEIGESSLNVQVKLLNIIENKTTRRLGSTETNHVDVRIIAATNKNLEKGIKNKLFREDLFYRLKVFQLTLPSLNEHKEDISFLVDHFIQFFNKRFNKKIQGIDKNAEKLLYYYNWPGNVRELRNVIERATILETTDYIRINSLPGEIRKSKTAADVRNVEEWFYIPEDGFKLDDIERMIIQKTLQFTKNNQTKAAKVMGVNRDKLRYKLKKYNMKS
jgi:DNA-binding NtrC family response regulator